MERVITVNGAPATIPSIRVDSDGQNANIGVRISDILNDMSHKMYCVEIYADASRKSGNFVHFPEQFAHIPVLIGRDEKPVLLSKIVEEIETIVDPSEVLERFSTLSYTQIVAALIFLRKISQFNVKGIDIDEVEDIEIERSEAFQEIVSSAMDVKDCRIVHP